VSTLGESIQFEFPKDILDSARLTVPELKVEMAVFLYSQGRLSIGKARELAGMSLWEFRQLLASRRISPHYDVTDLEKDVNTLRQMGQLRLSSSTIHPQRAVGRYEKIESWRASDG